tara:strand:+ start:389 stop:571 length:183 start_codon:yes stop_codon:yes gene_type:complete
MDDFLEFDEVKKTVKSINLDDFSVEDLIAYKLELNKEIERVNSETNKKIQLQKEAEKLFK